MCEATVKQRSTMAIVTLVLHVTSHSGGASKTKIMRNLMLTLERVNRYCALMQERGLIRYCPETRAYTITQKGLLVLERCNELAGYIEPINELIGKYRISNSVAA